MFLASVGQPSEVELFTYYLARDLGKTISELDDMPAAEYAAWQSFHKVRQQQEELAVKTASHG